MATVTERNGVNLMQLTETVNLIKASPELARFRFRATTRWESGGRSRTNIQGFFGANQEDTSREAPFTLIGDEPPVLLGTNAGPNAVEVALHALGSCLAVGFAYNAAAMGIELRSLEYEMEGDLDLRGFLGLSDTVRAGYSGVTIRYRVDCDAPREKLDELWAYVEKTSPLLDIFRNPVPVSIERAG